METQVPDKTLLRRIRLGDTTAFENVFREHFGNLCDFVDGYVRSRGEAEEIVDDLFYALWLRRAVWRPTTTVRASLFAAAHNRALGFRRRSALERGVDADSLGEVLHTHRLDPGHGPDATPEAKRLHMAIAQLPERARLAVRLRWLERMQYAEIAEAMDIPVKGVQKLVNSAVHAVRLSLEPHVESGSAEVSDALIDRYLASEASSAERDQLDRWLGLHPGRGKALELMRGDLTGAWDTNQGWHRLNERIVEHMMGIEHKKSSAWMRSPVFIVSAVVVIATAAALTCGRLQ